MFCNFSCQSCVCMWQREVGTQVKIKRDSKVTIQFSGLSCE